jgi:hypothetical protein
LVKAETGGLTGGVCSGGDFLETFETEDAGDDDPAGWLLIAHRWLGGDETNRMPIAKTPIRANFCMRGSCRCESSGIGMISRVMSVTIFMEALKNQTASKLMQEPPTEGSQKRATGRQLTKALTTAQVP